jgi:pyridoxal phosphate enzyme (YggS family)
MSDKTLYQNYSTLKQQLKQVDLLAVSKRQPLEKMRAVYELGQRLFAENYVQEAVDKITTLNWPDVQWHYIGQIQSNKTKLIAEHFDWVQSLDRLNIAEKLNTHCLQLGKKLQVCIAVNIDNEPQKGGVVATQLQEFAQQIKQLPQLQLRGIMVIPKARESYKTQLSIFKETKQLYDGLNHHGLELDTLSMGMSGDYVAALAAGSTMVRIGTLLFGPRES